MYSKNVSGEIIDINIRVHYDLCVQSVGQTVVITLSTFVSVNATPHQFQVVMIVNNM